MSLRDGLASIIVGGPSGLPTPSMVADRTVGPHGAVAETRAAAAATCWLEEPCRKCFSGVTVTGAGGLKTGSFGWQCSCQKLDNGG